MDELVALGTVDPPYPNPPPKFSGETRKDSTRLDESIVSPKPFLVVLSISWTSFMFAA